MAQKINTDRISGFPERLPGERIAELRLLDKIRSSFELFGFSPIETSAVERIEVLNAKNNGGIRNQIYRLYQVDVTSKDEDGNPLEWQWVPTESCLHFDLTVPLARYVASNLNSLTFPFRRYQIQKVWRGERAQKGRLREFYQCDIDIIGNGKLSLRADSEIPFIISHIFKELELGGFKIAISHRGILEGILSSHSLHEKQMFAVFDVIDELAKIGRIEVEKKLHTVLEISQDLINTLLAVASISGEPDHVLEQLESFRIGHPRFIQGVNELREVAKHLSDFKMPKDTYLFDLSIIRGLQYYTGIVYETFLDQFPDLSVCSGGRYDNLASLFTKQNLPGVGISIGLTRLFDYLKDANVLDIESQTPTRVLVTVQDQMLLQSAFGATATLRSNAIPAEVYLEERGLEDQLKYASKKKIPLAVIFNQAEESDDICNLKNLLTGAQRKITFDSLVAEIRKDLKSIRDIRKHKGEAAD